MGKYGMTLKGIVGFGLVLCWSAGANPFSIQKSYELAELGRSRLAAPAIDTDFQARLARVLEVALGLKGAAKAGMGPLLTASLSLPKGKQVAFVFGYARGAKAGKAKRWFIAFTSSGHYVTPIEVPADGSADLMAFQSVEPAGVFWILPSKKARQVIHFDVVHELQVYPVTASNFDPSPRATNYVVYPLVGGAELLIFRVSSAQPRAEPGVVAVPNTTIRIDDLFVSSLLANFDTIRKSVTKIRRVVYAPTS